MSPSSCHRPTRETPGARAVPELSRMTATAKKLSPTVLASVRATFCDWTAPMLPVSPRLASLLEMFHISGMAPAVTQGSPNESTVARSKSSVNPDAI